MRNSCSLDFSSLKWVRKDFIWMFWCCENRLNIKWTKNTQRETTRMTTPQAWGCTLLGWPPTSTPPSIDSTASSSVDPSLRWTSSEREKNHQVDVEAKVALDFTWVKPKSIFHLVAHRERMIETERSILDNKKELTYGLTLLAPAYLSVSKNQRGAHCAPLNI